MKIGYIVSHLGTGGAEKLVVQIANELVEKGIEVCIIMLFDKKGMPYEILNKEKVEVIELNFRNRFNLNIAYEIFKNTRDCDIVHSNTYYAQLYSAIMVKKQKLITTEHSTNNRRRKILGFKIIDGIMYSKYKKIICISDGVKENLLKWSAIKAKKAVVIKNGIDIEKIIQFSSKKNYGFESNMINLVCVGRMTEAKNHIKLIEALKYVDSNVQLILVGDGELRDKINKKIVKEKLEDRVTLMGQQKDIYGILKQANIFILPSKWEGFGIAVVEALACGLPVIVSDVEGVRELVGNDMVGIKVNPNNIKEITKAINKIANNITYYSEEKLKKIRIEESRKYNIEETASRWLEVYEEIRER